LANSKQQKHFLLQHLRPWTEGGGGCGSQWVGWRGWPANLPTSSVANVDESRLSNVLPPERIFKITFI